MQITCITTCDIHKLTCTHTNYAKYTHIPGYAHVHRMLIHMNISPLQMCTEIHIKTYMHRHRLDVQPIHSYTGLHTCTHSALSPPPPQRVDGRCPGLHNPGPSGHIWELWQGPNQCSKCGRHSGRCSDDVDCLPTTLCVNILFLLLLVGIKGHPSCSRKG